MGERAENGRPKNGGLLPSEEAGPPVRLRIETGRYMSDLLSK
jgi:hypothetical protein